MKTYKHKKTGEIATYQDGILKSSGFAVEIGVEPSNEFWEEVVEKDYEVLSWYFGDMNITKNPDGSASEYFIHSVKRLSDGEVFTVKDIIKTSVDKSYCQIYGFRIVNDKLIIDCTHSYLCSLKGINILEDIQHVTKKPLFTTEDGVDIYEGDNFYVVLKDLSNIEITKCKASVHSKYEKYLDFSTKQAAEEYILMNKPCLSINDLWNCNSNKDSKDSWMIISKKTLQELVKSKL
jgi:hypothetical protein